MKQKYFTQTILFSTVLFGRNYFWMQDVDGTVYLAGAKPTGYSKNPPKFTDIEGRIVLVKDADFVPDLS